YGSVDELIGQTRPDVVIVATPPAAHLEPCLRAIEAGCHVFCEKPLAQSVAEADRILAAARAGGRLVAVNQEFREHPIFRAIREQIASARFGRLAFCQVWQLMDLPPWKEPTRWRADMANRALFEGGIHLVDLLIWIFGAQAAAVSAQFSAGFHERQDSDAIQLVTVEFPGGRLGQVTVDRLCRAGTRYLEVRADCEEASLRASFGGRATARVGIKRAEPLGALMEFGYSGLAWAEQGRSRKTLARNPPEAAVVGSTRLLEGLVAAIDRGGEPPSSALEARHVLAVIEAAYESGRTGRRVELSGREIPV
ncbi:MAG TPA: Gfo/Idh/MocA family oxidoreductase, partial [Vicinamibacterales bacterium]|nr:Gfo/Idh/MocA family oxidoreductase [Vicinamibacterales bacterium]